MSEETRHTTPDGLFTLVVNESDDTIGFEGRRWQTQADQLPAYRVSPKIENAAQLMAALVERRLVMVISRFDETGDEIRDVWISDDGPAELRCADEGEFLEIRYWDGGH